MNRFRPASGYPLSTTITRTDGATGDEYDVDVDYRVTPGRPERRHLRNGDPGYPAEDAEVEIDRAVRNDTSEAVELTDDELAARRAARQTG